MTIENILNVFSVDLKRIADALEKGGEFNKIPPTKADLGAVEKKKETVKKKTKKKKETVKVEKDISVDDLEGAVETLTADDVKNEARTFVDGASTEGKRERFEEAQKIIKILGATSLNNIVPEKYIEAIDLFRKAVAGWKK